MLFERIESEGLAHSSYVVGDEGTAAVVDPRRDAGVYVDLATAQGLRIAHVFETHRNVRKVVELEEEGRIAGATHIHVTQLPNRLGEVPHDRPVYIFCGSGLCSMTAASLLQREGWSSDGSQLAVVLGGLAGWNSTTCKIV